MTDQITRNELKDAIGMPDIFRAFFSTPDDERKNFKRAGGFSGTSVSPYYLVKRLTHTFGLCGDGWGTELIDKDIVQLPTGQVMIYIRLHLWYYLPGQEHTPENKKTVEQIGGDIVANIIWNKDANGNKTGVKALENGTPLLEIDDEAFKKAYTDAFSKAASYVGLGGDIHDGMTDNKYTADKPWDVSHAQSQEAYKKVQAVKASVVTSGKEVVEEKAPAAEPAAAASAAPAPPAPPADSQPAAAPAPAAAAKPAATVTRGRGTGAAAPAPAAAPAAQAPMLEEPAGDGLPEMGDSTGPNEDAFDAFCEKHQLDGLIHDVRMGLEAWGVEVKKTAGANPDVYNAARAAMINLLGNVLSIVTKQPIENGMQSAESTYKRIQNEQVERFDTKTQARELRTAILQHAFQAAEALAVRI